MNTQEENAKNEAIVARSRAEIEARIFANTTLLDIYAAASSKQNHGRAAVTTLKSIAAWAEEALRRIMAATPKADAR